MPGSSPLTRAVVFACWLQVVAGLIPSPVDAAGAFDRCFDLADEGDREGAIACIDAVGHPVAAYFEAEQLEALGRMAEALAAYEAYLASGHPGFSESAAAVRRRLERSVRGRIDVRCEAVGAEVRIDGRGVGACPMISGFLDPKTYRIEVWVDGSIVSTDEATVESGQAATCCAPPPPLSVHDWLPWTVTSLGAALLVTGAAFHIANRVAGEEYNRTLGPVYSDRQLKMRGELYEDISLAAYISGAGVSLAGLVWLLAFEPDDSVSIHVRPRGLSLGWTW